MEGTKAEQIGDVISIAGETVAGETGKTVAGSSGLDETIAARRTTAYSFCETGTTAAGSSRVDDTATGRLAAGIVVKASARGTEEEEREEKEEEEKEDDTPLILSIAGTERLSLAKRAI
jgi:hypothetical protein